MTEAVKEKREREEVETVEEKSIPSKKEKKGKETAEEETIPFSGETGTFHAA
jgi:hypothetical protein